MSDETLIDRLRAWPSPQIGADYSVNAIKAQMAEAADLIEALSARTPPAMSADHIGEASPAVTDVGKLIQSPLVEKLVGALKRISAMTPGAANAVDARALHLTVKAIADEALDHIPDATNMVEPVEAVSVRRRILAGWLLSPQLNEDEAINVVANHPAIQPLYTHPAPIKPSADTGELRERVAQIIEAAIERHNPGNSLRHTIDDADAILDLIQSERAG